MGIYSICGSVGANTGGIDCDVTRGNPQQIIPGSAVFTPTDYASQASFKAAFIAKIKQPSGATSKLFPFPVIQQVTDKTVAAKFATLGYGLEVKLLRSKAGYEFDVIAGSSLEKKLIKFDGKTIPIFIFDDQSNIWGVMDSSLNFKGAKFLVGVEPRGFGDANAAKTTKISISLIDSRDFVENAKFASTTFSSTDLVGLQDGFLKETASHASNVYHIGAFIGIDEIISSVINLHDQYTTQLQVTSLWTAKSGAPNFTTSLPITSIADDAANGGYLFTFDTTAYGLVATGANIKLIPASPSVLDAGDVTSIEIQPIILTK